MSEAGATEAAVESEPFHGCPVDPACPWCSGAAPGPAEPFDWSFLDGAYCISLASRPDRMAEAAAEFHRVGLCRHVTFYRPSRHPTSPAKGIWQSHAAVARHALRHGRGTVLIMEDDVAFPDPLTPATVRMVGAALPSLPPDWTIFFLGHWALWAYPVGRHVLRVSAACAHAYVASPRLLAWLDRNPERRPEIPLARLAGKGIDAAYARLPQTFAFFPMLAIQRPASSDHVVYDRNKPILTLKHRATRTRFREQLLSGLMRPNQYAVLAATPLILLGRAARDLVARARARPPDD